MAHETFIAKLRKLQLEQESLILAGKKAELLLIEQKIRDLMGERASGAFDQHLNTQELSDKISASKAQVSAVENSTLSQLRTRLNDAHSKLKKPQILIPKQ